jgi:hypothetical protein
MVRHFISYPKSGRSWVRYALEHAGVRHSIRFHHDTFEFNDPLKPLPNLSYSKRLADYSTGCKVVYMSRDPRDIMVSLYYQVTGRFRDFFGYDGSISDFIRDDYFGASKLRIFRDHWDEICRLGLAYRISYEQCHENFQSVLLSVLEFYEVNVDSNRVHDAVLASSFERMRGMEISGNFPEPWLRPRNGFLKTRVGRPLNFRAALNQEDVKYLDSAFSL